MVWKVRLRGEVKAWYDELTDKDLAVTDRAIARLEAEGHMLRMPLSRALGEGLFELRFNCAGLARRITYVFEPDKQVITLTTFHKTKNNERREILRARRAQADRAVRLKNQTKNQQTKNTKRGKS